MDDSDIVKLERDEDCSCKIHKYGATVISWIDKGEEMIFVSSKSHFDNKKAIRGGIPLVFPNFGPWELGPQHGFARISTWEASASEKDESGNPVARLVLKDNEDTRKIWNFRFQLVYKVTLMKNRLTIVLAIENTDNQAFDFTTLLHTYFRVPDVKAVTISGLEGLHYADKVRDKNRFMEDRKLVTVAENVDRVYESTPDTHHIAGVVQGKTVVLNKVNLPDTVVWNPWATVAASMSDFGDDEYHNMICVEAGYVAKRKVLNPQETFTTSQTISVQ